MSEELYQLAVRRISSKLMSLVTARKIEAWRVKCTEKIKTSIFATSSSIFIQHPKEKILSWGERKEANKESQFSLRSSRVRPM